MWPFGRRPVAERRLRDLEKRLDDVELDVGHLNKQIEKLRGRVTGGLRKQREPYQPPDPQGMPPGLDPVSRRIWQRRLGVAPEGVNSAEG